MSFTGTTKKGAAYAPGWFLADNEGCTRETRQIKQTGATEGDNGSKYVKMGTVLHPEKFCVKELSNKRRSAAQTE